MLYIFLRKKDHLGDVSSNHQSVRTIKSYCIDNLEHLDKRWEEIKKLCELFGARAYIHIQCQNNRDIGLNIIQEVSVRLLDGGTNFSSIFDSVVGQIRVREKRWVVDLDEEHLEYEEDIIDAMRGSLPFGEKVIVKIPTRRGKHLITRPFKTEGFDEHLISVQVPVPDIQKKNPTLLYYPNSLK